MDVTDRIRTERCDPPDQAHAKSIRKPRSDGRSQSMGYFATSDKSHRSRPLDTRWPPERAAPAVEGDAIMAGAISQAGRRSRLG